MMTSATNNDGSGSRLFHSYENVGYDDQTIAVGSHHAMTLNGVQNNATDNCSSLNAISTSGSHNSNINSSNNTISGIAGESSAPISIAVNKTAIDSPFVEPIIHDPTTASNVAQIPTSTTTKILSATDYSGNTRTFSPRAPLGQNLVTKLITFPTQSPMDSLKEWSVSTFKCTKQLINEKRGICPVTNDSQLQNDIEQLRENRDKLVQMLRFGSQMTNHYTQLVKTQKQLYSLMNEMSIKCFNTNNNNNNNNNTSNNNQNIGASVHLNSYTSKQVIANFSSLGNNLSSTTTTSPTHQRTSMGASGSTRDRRLEDSLPVLNHMRNTNLNLVDDFKKNAMTLNVAIKNGEKLLAALNFYSSNLSTLIGKTIEDTLTTVKLYESARLEYDAEKNSLNFISPTAQTSIAYSSDKLELARMRYEQLKEDVQIKMRLLEENIIKVMHKQLLLFNGAFASYTSGNTAALDVTLKQFSIKDTSN